MSNATQAAPALPLMDETYYRSRRRRQGLREDLNSFWFLLPILALFVILFLVPLVQTAYYSFTDFNGYSTNMKFVGFDNYKKVFSDPSTLSGLGFTILYAIVVMIGVTAAGHPTGRSAQPQIRRLQLRPLRILLLFRTIAGHHGHGMEIHLLPNENRRGQLDTHLTRLRPDSLAEQQQLG